MRINNCEKVSIHVLTYFTHSQESTIWIKIAMNFNFTSYHLILKWINILTISENFSTIISLNETFRSKLDHVLYNWQPEISLPFLSADGM